MNVSYVTTGLAAILIAALAWTQARKFPFQDLQSGLGPAFFPCLLLIALVVLGSGSVLYGFLSRVEDAEKKGEEAPGRFTALLIFAFLVAYGISFSRAGFLVSTFAFLAVVMIILKIKWWLTLVVAGLLTGILQVVFATFFKVPLP